MIMGLIQDYSLVFIFFILPIIFVLQPLFLAKITKGKDETNLVSLKRKKRLLYRQIKELEMECVEKGLLREIEKSFILQQIDFSWKKHLQKIAFLRDSIGWRAYGQKDPLTEYKKEAFELFSNLLDKLKLDYVTILMNLKVVTQERQLSSSTKTIDKSDDPKCLLIVKKDQKISRNERCEATGKKFKNCCGGL